MIAPMMMYFHQSLGGSTGPIAGGGEALSDADGETLDDVEFVFVVVEFEFAAVFELEFPVAFEFELAFKFELPVVFTFAFPLKFAFKFALAFDPPAAFEFRFPAMFVFCFGPLEFVFPLAFGFPFVVDFSLGLIGVTRTAVRTLTATAFVDSSLDVAICTKAGYVPAEA